jgi:hypothetical protein
MTERAFGFLRINERESKPRSRGLTEIRGAYYTPVGRRYLEDLFVVALTRRVVATGLDAKPSAQPPRKRLGRGCRLRLEAEGQARPRHPALRLGARGPRRGRRAFVTARVARERRLAWERTEMHRSTA